MKNIFLVLAIVLSAGAPAQQKINFDNTENLLKKIQPNQNISSWILISSEKGTHHHVASSGKLADYNVQPAGFMVNNDANYYYYFVFTQGSSVAYVTDKEQLRNFIGTVENAEEAALLGILDGYFLDEEFKNLSGNHQADKSTFKIELAKITSEKCPFAKSHYEISVPKNGKNISAVKDLGVYFQVFDKSCANNPHYSELQKQIDSAKAKNEEEAIKNKEMKAKLKKQLLKRMKRD